MSSETNRRISLDDYYSERKPVTITTFNANMDFFDNTDSLLSQVLKKKNIQHIHSPLMFIIREFLTNANKANLKRIFFKVNDLNINDPNDYNKGICEFSKQVKDENGVLASYLERYKLFVKLLLQEYGDRQFTLFIINNTEIIEKEKERINEKIKLFSQNAEGLDLLDSTEGAGMGIFLSLKMLEQIGISSNSFSIGNHKGLTVAKLSFKYDDIHPAPYSIIAEEILKIVNTLPKFPNNIKALLSKLLNKDVTLDEISNDLAKDPSLSTDILKLVNSAKFSLQRKISSIKEALNYAGLKGLKNLLYSYGAMQIIDKRFGTINEVWDHSYKTAKIASIIAEKLKLNKKDDEFYTAGLLHDIGKILLMNFDLNKAKKIDEVCRIRGVELPVLEEIIMGLSHARIGAEIAKFWEFPESLVSAIAYHHDPIMADNNKELVNTINLANYLSNLNNKTQLNAYAIEPDVRDFFKINSTYDIIKFVDNLGIYSE